MFDVCYFSKKSETSKSFFLCFLESESRLLQEEKKVQQPEKPDNPKSHSETNQEVPKVDSVKSEEKEED